MRTFIESRLFPRGGREYTWVAIAGIAWLLVGVCNGLLALTLIMTFWYAPVGLAVAVLGCFVPLWFAHQALVWKGSSWTVIAFVFAAWAEIVFVADTLAGGRSLAFAVAAFIPTTLSAVAVWEVRRRP